MPHRRYSDIEESEYIDRFFTYLEIPSLGACWMWRAFRDRHGYGNFGYRGRTVFTHRLILSWETGVPITTPLSALHSCDNPPCCNPAHLSWGTQAENLRDMSLRGRGRGAGPDTRTHCREGHELTPENTYSKRRGRVARRSCRTCRLATNRASKERRA